MPSDPKELLLLAAKSNNLTTDDLKPWHVKATFAAFDDQGKPTDQGTYEEFWAAPNKFKRTYSTSSFTRSEFGSNQGLLRAGSGDLNLNLVLAAQELTKPLPDENLEAGSYSVKETQVGAATFNCVHHDPGGPNYCLGTQQAILRVSVIGPDQIVRNRVLAFQNHFVPGDLKIIRSGQTLLTFHVDSIESLPTVDDADFAPSADAVHVPVNISGAVAQGMILYAQAPKYPPVAKANHVTGTVVLQGIIGKDGHVKNLKVVSGHADLQMAAIDAVRFWRYKPYLLNGEPVEVMTTINVVFALNL
ncbi:MAG TPA: energy transducer TonB [Terracidiphilus sp.]|jgi:TonB family protein